MPFIQFLIEMVSSEHAVSVLSLILTSLLTIVLFQVGQAYSDRHKLKYAAVDRRLEKHQEAYTYALSMPAIANRDQREGPEAEKLNATLTEIHDWWKSNCLYLGKDIAEKFRMAKWSAEENPQARIDGDIEAHVRNFKRFDDLMRAIEKECDLPSLQQEEKEEMKKKNKDEE